MAEPVRTSVTSSIIRQCSIVRILLFVMGLIMVGMLWAGCVCYGETFTDENGIVWNYEVSESTGEASILGVNTFRTNIDLSIPASIDSRVVSRIGEEAFRGRRGINTLVVPEGVREIGESAFYSSGFSRIDLPDSLRSIERSAFMKSELMTLKIPDNVTSLGRGLLWGSKISDAHLRFPESVYSIPAETFGNCLQLEHYEVQDTIDTIGKQAFESCVNMKDIYIPASVQMIGSDGFLRAGAYLSAGQIFTICGERGSYAESYAMENGIAFAEESREEYNKRIETEDSAVITNDVVFPDSDGKGTYTDKDGIEWDYYVDDNFERTVLLTGGRGTGSNGVLVIPSMIGQYRVKGVRAASFCDRDDIRKLIVSSGVKSIGFCAFRNDLSISEVILPESVNVVEETAFCDCESLQKFTLDENNPYFYTIDGVLYDRQGDSLVCYPLGRRESQFTIPDGITTTYNNAFAASRLRKATFSSSMISIGEQAFITCNMLEVVDLNSGLKVINSGAFFGCPNLKYADLPDGLETIGDKAYAATACLRGVYIPTSVNAIGEGCFEHAGNELTKDKPFTIYGSEGTYAETYARDNNIPFVSASREQFEKDMGITDGSSDDGHYQSDYPVIHIKNKQVIAGPDRLSKKTNSKDFVLGTTAKTAMTYRSSNKRVATVNTEGNVRIHGPGTAVITIEALATDHYLAATKTVTIRVTFAKPKMTAKKKGRKVKITWGKVIGADGYKLYIKGPGEKKFKCRLTKSARVKSVTHKGLTKGKKYQYKIRAYKKVGGKTLYSPYSKTRTVKI